MERKCLMCDLKYAVKLKELGVKQDSLFYIDEYDKIYNEKEAELILDENKYYRDIREPIKLYSAFIAEELTKLLPKWLSVPKCENLYINSLNNGYWVCYGVLDNGKLLKKEDSLFNDKKLSNVLAQQLIWCIENEYIKLANITKSQTQ